MATYYVKQGNRSPLIQSSLLQPDGAVEDLTTATNVTLRARKANTSTYIVDDLATITDAPNGVVQYQFDATQTDDPGLLLIEWVKDAGLASEETYPNYSYDAIYIERSL